MDYTQGSKRFDLDKFLKNIKDLQANSQTKALSKNFQSQPERKIILNKFTTL